MEQNSHGNGVLGVRFAHNICSSNQSHSRGCGAGRGSDPGARTRMDVEENSVAWNQVGLGLFNLFFGRQSEVFFKGTNIC